MWCWQLSAVNLSWLWRHVLAQPPVPASSCLCQLAAACVKNKPFDQSSPSSERARVTKLSCPYLPALFLPQNNDLPKVPTALGHLTQLKEWNLRGNRLPLKFEQVRLCRRGGGRRCADGK